MYIGKNSAIDELAQTEANTGCYASVGSPGREQELSRGNLLNKLSQYERAQAVMKTEKVSQTSVSAEQYSNKRVLQLKTILKDESDKGKIIIKCTPKNNRLTRMKSSQSSIYRGISRNGKSWQVSTP